MTDDREDDSQRFYAEVTQRQEHEEWIKDQAAQQEYKSWLDQLGARDEMGG